MKQKYRVVLLLLCLGMIIFIRQAIVSQDLVLPSPQEKEVTQEAPKMTFIGLLVAGGPVMIPISLCSIGGLALILRLIFSLRMKNFINSNTLEEIKKYVKEGLYDKALQLCSNGKTVLERVFKVSIEKRGYGKSEVEKVMQEKIDIELTGIIQANSYLSSIAVISPMLGLLGTVTGMIRAFNVIAFEAGLGKPALLAKGVSEALITTAAGLIIAIPYMSFYFYFRGRLRNIITRMGEECTNLLEILYK